MIRAKTYSKYVVKRSIGGRNVSKNEDGTPVLSDCVKTNIRVTPDLVETMNNGWDSIEKPISYYYVVDEEATERDRIASEKKIKLKASVKDSLKDRNNKLLAENLENERLKIEIENAELKKKLEGSSASSGEKKADKELRTRLFKEAKELELDVAKNIKTEDLQNKINEAITE